MHYTTVLLTLAFAASTQAAPKSFTYSGVVTEKGGIKCTGSINYTVVDDAGAEDFQGLIEVDGCLGGSETLDDGTFSIMIDRNERTAILTELSSGLEIHGSQGEHRGPVKACTAQVCPPATTMTCIFGAGPDGTEPTTKDCGLT